MSVSVQHLHQMIDSSKNNVEQHTTAVLSPEDRIALRCLEWLFTQWPQNVAIMRAVSRTKLHSWQPAVNSFEPAAYEWITCSATKTQT